MTHIIDTQIVFLPIYHKIPWFFKIGLQVQEYFRFYSSRSLFSLCIMCLVYISLVSIACKSTAVSFHILFLSFLCNIKSISLLLWVSLLHYLQETGEGVFWFEHPILYPIKRFALLWEKFIGINIGMNTLQNQKIRQ